MPDKFPSEGTLVVNATHQQEKRGLFDDGIVFAPTQIEEANLGFDIGVTNATTGATEFGFQYKAIRNEVAKRQFKPGEKKTGAFALPFYPDQGAKLLLNAQRPREMFYALPTITSQNQLQKTLEKTVFVDAYGLYPVIADYQNCQIGSLSALDIFASLRSFSRFYVTKQNSGGSTSVFLKERHEGGAYANPKYYYEIPQQYIKDWQTIEGLAFAGYAGTPVVRQGEKASEYRQRFEYLTAVDELITRLLSLDAPRITEITRELGPLLDTHHRETPLINGVQIVDNTIQITPPAVDDVRTLAILPEEDANTPTRPLLVESIIEVDEELGEVSDQLVEIIGGEESPLAFEGSAHCHLLSTEL